MKKNEIKNKAILNTTVIVMLSDKWFLDYRRPNGYEISSTHWEYHIHPTTRLEKMEENYHCHNILLELHEFLEKIPEISKISYDHNMFGGELFMYIHIEKEYDMESLISNLEKYIKINILPNCFPTLKKIIKQKLKDSKFAAESSFYFLKNNPNIEFDEYLHLFDEDF